MEKPRYFEKTTSAATGYENISWQVISISMNDKFDLSSFRKEQFAIFDSLNSTKGDNSCAIGLSRSYPYHNC